MALNMIQWIGLIFIEMFLVYGIIHKLINIISSKNPKVKLLLVGLAGVLLLSSHYEFYMQCVKEKNHYERMGIERAYSSDKLNKQARIILTMYHPDKVGEGQGQIFNELTRMRNLLMDPLFSNLYDVFGDFNYPELPKANDYQMIKSEQSLNVYIELIAFYMVAFILSTVVSYGRRFGGYRVLSNIIIVIFFAWELYVRYFAGEDIDPAQKTGRHARFEIERNFLDDYLPIMAIFQRFQLIRMLILGLLSSIRLYYDLMRSEPINQFESSLQDKITQLYENIESQTLVFRQPQDLSKPKSFNLEQFIQNKNTLEQLKKLAQNYRDDQPKDSKAKRYIKNAVKYLLFSLFLYQIYTSFFQEKTPELKQNVHH